jgi:hypothetical protein
MADTELPVLDEEQLKAKLQEILQDWPLYRPFRYTGSSYGFVPADLSLFCTHPKCGKQQQWHAEIYTGTQKHGFEERAYTCRNCGEHVTRYYFYWTGNPTASLFFKVGQYPPLEIEPPRRLGLRLSCLSVLTRQ